MNLVSVYGAYTLILGNWVLSSWFLGSFFFFGVCSVSSHVSLFDKILLIFLILSLG